MNELKNIKNLSIITAIGKRKTSVAKVFFRKGEKNIKINKKKFLVFFGSVLDPAKKILELLKPVEDYEIMVNVHGGGIISQIDAISLAIAKAICLIDPTQRSFLKKNSFLTRDSRIKERRKYGLKKARKASQYSKR